MHPTWLRCRFTTWMIRDVDGARWRSPRHAASSGTRLTAYRTFPANRARASAFRTSSIVADGIIALRYANGLRSLIRSHSFTSFTS